MSVVHSVYSKIPVSEPTKAWFVREFKSTSFIFGPISLYSADREARRISKSNTSGLSEVVTFENGVLFVVATYLRGKKRYKGLRSNQAALYNLPPTL
jgi:hypothetical protein